MAEIFPVQRKTLSSQSINQSINQSNIYKGVDKPKT